MIVKNGQIIAIGNVNTGGTLSGNGLSGSPLGLRDDAVKLTPASTGIDIKKNVAEDGKIEYQLGISADITVESTIVSGGEGIKSEKIDDRTYKVSVSGDYLTSADNSLSGKNLVLKDNKWTELSASEVTPYSGGEGIKVENHIISVSGEYYPLNTNPSGYLVEFDLNEYAKSAWVDQEFQKKGNYITSAGIAGEYLVLKDNTWVLMPNPGAVYSAGPFIKITDDNKISGYDWNPELAKKLDITAFDTYSSTYSSYVEKQFSSFSATVSSTYVQKVDIPIYSAKNDYIDVIPDGGNFGLSGYDWTEEIAKKIDVTASAGWDVIPYSADDFIKIVDHKISGYDWTEEIAKKQDKLTEYQLSAISSVSGKQDMLSNEQLSAISSVSAIQAFSGNWVTSATETISDESLSYVLKKDGESSKWEGVDLSEVGKTYKVESETPELLKVTSGDNNTTFTLSAKPYPVVPEIPSISGYGTSAWYDEPNNQYKISANIVGINGISANYNSENNQWQIGASASNLAYLQTYYTNNSLAVASGSVIKFQGGVLQDITIDDNGYITIPDTVDRMTICMNATLDNNIPEHDPHNYMLNQFTLSAVGGAALVRTHDYYPSEVGAADSNIATTIKHSAGTKYCIVYEGNDVQTQAHLNVHLTMLEEVISMSDSSAAERKYTAIEPVYVNDQTNQISLKYDDEFFTLKDKEEAGGTSKVLTLADSSGHQVDPETFQKLLDSVNHRIVETLPIGVVGQTDNQGAGVARSYLFRPMIEFDMKPATGGNIGTTARILTYQKDSNATVQVAVFEVSDEVNGTLDPVWLSEQKLLDHSAGEHVLGTHSSCALTVTIKPEKLYYVAVITRGGHVGLIGMNNAITSDTGICDIAYWSGNENTEWTVNDQIRWNIGLKYKSDDLGSTGQANFKPYVGFRNP